MTVPARRHKVPRGFVFSRTWSWTILLIMLSRSSLPGAEAVRAAVESIGPRVPASAETNLPLKRLGPGRFALGDVSFDQEQRMVSFPARLNLNQGNVEYLVVTSTGKTHESLLRTEAKPHHLQLALLLLGARGSTNAFPEDAAHPLPGDNVEIEVSWDNDGKPQRFAAEDLVQDRKKNAPMLKGPWRYNGSRVREDGFAAEVDGSIISLITDPDALINNPRPGREDDDNWLVRTNGLPRLNTPVEVRIRLMK
jgi:hypothetical protein